MSVKDNVNILKACNMNWINEAEFNNIVERIIRLTQMNRYLELRQLAGMYIDPEELRINKVLLGALYIRAEHYCLTSITIQQLQS